MQVKRNLVRRPPTEDEINNLVYPKDKFDLISVDYVDEWDLEKRLKPAGAPNNKVYTYPRKATHITVRCKKCGSIKKEATDRPDMSCKIGPCTSKWKDLTGKRYGSLTVEGFELAKVTQNQRKRNWYWKCRCDCGNYIYRTEHDLEHMGYRYCKECAKKARVAGTKLPGEKARWHRMMRYYKKGASRANRPFKLTEEQFISVATKNCAYCGAAPEIGAYRVACNGIDRIDNTKGYTMDNVAPCCMRCNYMKNKLTKEEFFRHIAKIYAFNNLGLKLNDHPEREYASSEAEMGATPRG